MSKYPLSSSTWDESEIQAINKVIESGNFTMGLQVAEFERELIRERTIEGLRRTKIQGTTLGRPKGSRDSKPRPKAGYLIRQALKKKEADNKKGINTDLKNYL